MEIMILYFGGNFALQRENLCQYLCLGSGRNDYLGVGAGLARELVAVSQRRFTRRYGDPSSGVKL